MSVPLPLLFSGLLLVACSSPAPRPAAEILVRQARSAPVQRLHFPAADAVLAGFDPLLPGQDPRVTEEQVLFGLELCKGRKKQRWMLMLQVDEPPVSAVDASGSRNPRRLDTRNVRLEDGRSYTFHSERCRMRVSLFDQHGDLLQTSTVRVPWDYLLRGFLRSCRLARRMAERGSLDRVRFEGREWQTEEANREIMAGFATLGAFLNIVRDNDMLAKILWQVIDQPSLFSVLWSGGVRLKVSARLDQAQPAVLGLDGFALDDLQEELPDCYRVPLQIFINDTPALDLVLRVTEPSSPLRVCGGIVAVEGMRPTNDGVRMRLELLAARRLR